MSLPSEMTLGEPLMPVPGTSEFHPLDQYQCLSEPSVPRAKVCSMPARSTSVAGPLRPAFKFNGETFYMHGINVGVMVQF